MKLPQLTRRFWSQPIPPQRELEKELRAQIAELERQGVAFNEAIGLLRAALSLSNDAEIAEQQRSQEIAQLRLHPNPEPTSTALELAAQLSAESWQQHAIHAHTLRSLYQQILEAKRRFLRHWYDLLRRQISSLPPERQPLIHTLLENSFQGVLTLGVEQMEQRWRKEFQQMKTHSPLPLPLFSNNPTTQPSTPSPTASSDNLPQLTAFLPFEALLQSLKQQIHPTSTDHDDDDDEIS